MDLLGDRFKGGASTTSSLVIPVISVTLGGMSRPGLIRYECSSRATISPVSLSRSTTAATSMMYRKGLEPGGFGVEGDDRLFFPVHESS